MGHLKSFADMALPGEPFVVDGAAPPYGDSHRLVTSAPTGDLYVFAPVWHTMYGAE